MKKYLLLFTVLIAIIIYFSIQTTEKVLDLPLIAQKRTQWCWAANTEMVMRYLGVDTTVCRQCSLSSKYNLDSLEVCCYDSLCTNALTPCNSALSSNDYPFILSLLSYQADSVSMILDSTQIIERLDLNKPFVLAQIVQSRDYDTNYESKKINIDSLWIDHYLTGFGYINTCQDTWVLMRDPWEVCTGCTYAINYKTLHKGGFNIQEPEGGESFLKTFYNFRPSDVKEADSLLDEILKYWYKFIHWVSNLFCNNEIITRLKGNDIDNKQVESVLKSFLKDATQKSLSEIGLSNLSQDGSNNSFRLSEPIEKITYYLNLIRTSEDLTQKPKVKEQTKIINVLDLNGMGISEIQLTGFGDFWEIDRFGSCPWLPIAKAVAEINAADTTNFDLKNVKELSHISLLPTQYQFYEFSIDSSGKKYYLPKHRYNQPNIFFDRVMNESDFLYVKQTIFQNFLNNDTVFKPIFPTYSMPH